MKVIKMVDCSINTVYSGVYKITFPNDKIYIGISNHIYRRMLEHNTDFRNNLPIEKAIKKYGKITEFELLEEIPVNNRKLMREREKYWINFYKSNNKENGYNISNGGDGADVGYQNHQAKFTKEKLQLVYNDLKDNKLSLEQIANKYNINISSISRINNGHTYHQENIIYPIRKEKPFVAGINSGNSKFSQTDIDNIYQLLKNNIELSMKQIALMYNVDPSIIQNINNGKTYKNINFSYPLRNPKTGKRKIDDETIKQIIEEIKNNPKESLASISRKFGCSSKTISAINLGTIYKQKNEKYPIRNNQKAVSTIRGSAE